MEGEPAGRNTVANAASLAGGTTYPTKLDRLKHEGGLSVVRMLQGLNLGECPAAQRTARDDCLRYFQNHQHKMDYPRYVANGWQIGSGPVESACKLVVGSRLKQSGMRWSEAGSNALCQLRALYLSQPTCWDDYWKNYPN